jgi:hypothetical protein
VQESDIENILDGIKTLEKLSGGNLHQWRYTLENANSIWKRCPYQVGDLVRLTKTPEITKEKSWGWLGSKHFLIEGAIGRIAGREFYDGLFRFYVVFEHETWIDYQGAEHPVDRLAHYSFSENWLATANYDQMTCEAL